MPQYINKSALVAEIERLQATTMDEDGNFCTAEAQAEYKVLCMLESFIDTLEVIDSYEQCIQYPSIKDGIQANAETYSFNIESELFNQLTKGEQQELWRKEIEQAYIIGGDTGVKLARDPRYKENLEAKEAKGVDLDKEIQNILPAKYCWFGDGVSVYFKEQMRNFAKHFFELGLKAQKGK